MPAAPPLEAVVPAAPAGAADSVRDAHAAALRRAAFATTAGERAAGLRDAERLAGAYLATFSDSLLVRRTAAFAAAPARARREAALADSLYRAGRDAYGREGVPTAMVLWRQSLRHAAAARDSTQRAIVLAAVGAGFYAAGELDSAASYLERAYRLALRTADYRTQGNALGNLASVSKDRGELTRAAEQYERARQVRGRSGDSRGLAADHNNLALIAWELGDLAAARSGFAQALAINRADGRSRATALNLTNLADIATLEGDYAAADSAYREALALNAAAGDTAELAFVLADLGRLAARRGDLHAALDQLSRALALHLRSGASQAAVSLRGEIATVQAAMGDLEGAAATLQRARGEAAALDGEGAAAIALAQADLALQLGALGQAEADYARAARLYLAAGAGAGVAGAQLGQAVLRLLRDDAPGALLLLERATRRLASTGDRRGVALTAVLRGDVLRQAGDTSAARRTLTAARDSLAALGDAAGGVHARIALAELAAQQDALLAAEAEYRSALAHPGAPAQPQLAWRLHAGLGEVLRRRGALAAAAAELHVAVELLDSLAAGLRLPERRAGFLADKGDVYALLALVEHERGRADEAFAASERLRGRRMLDALALGRVAARTAGGAREQDLRRRIGELMAEVAADGDPWGGRREPGLGTRGAAAAREALNRVQQEYGELLVELRGSDRRHAGLVASQPSGWRAIARQLRSDEILLQYLLTDSTTLVLAVTHDTVRTLDLRVARPELRQLVDFARMAMLRAPQDDGSLWRAPLRRLHEHLLAPVEDAGLLAGRHRLVVIPHAELNFLPFAALLAADDRFLVERFEILHAPSATAWLKLQERARKPRRPAHVLALAARPDRLPAATREVNAIRDVWGRRATVLAGTSASERALRTRAADYDILHLATLGVLNRHNPLFSYVELAPGRGHDGRLEAHEVYELELDGQLIVLSACQTALASGTLADVPAGDDWIGLMHAFLESGADAVLASQWPVDDAATARLMHGFHRRLAAGQSQAAALAGAQRALLREPRLRQPFYWAGFILNGSSRP